VVKAVVDQLSGFMWDECSELDEGSVGCWVGCEGNVVIELVRVAPWRTKALDQLRTVQNS